MSSQTDVAIDTRFSNPLDFVPEEMPFDVPYGLPISLDRAQAALADLCNAPVDSANSQEKVIGKCLTTKLVKDSIPSCSTSKSSTIRQPRRWLWNPCGVDSFPSWSCPHRRRRWPRGLA